MVQEKSKPNAVNQLVQSHSMGEHLIRLDRLKAYQKAKEWTDSELARRCNRSPQQVGAWKSHKRLIGERLARAIESELGLPARYLDSRDTQEAGEAQILHQSDGVLTDGNIVRMVSRPFPVLLWSELPAMLNAENASLALAPRTALESHAVASTRAKFVQMKDDSMSPSIMLGDHVLVDPTEAPRAGDVVLISLPSREHFVRVFRPRTAHVFEGHPINANYQAISSNDDGAEVVGVMVEHRSYRRRP